MKKLVFLDALNALFQLDFGWFIWLLGANIHWAFIFAMTMVFFQKRKKHRLFYLGMLIILLWAFSDLMNILGWHISVEMQFWLISGNIALEATSDAKIFKRHKAWIGLGLFFALWVVFNLLM
ncbi:MAG: hypothetical protein CL943_01050 [Candidatus Diapherotrites archaeon]|uniref:Uncharacterized protein n=1 Tax=Candidatus Iainarchaeum sp. TaxID=3101447 RepID=A0A2D6M0D2_9ARCH|nr:hypothetical protein [Candidatus Diapherotrites archaeon]